LVHLFVAIFYRVEGEKKLWYRTITHNTW